jgi:hypothetical protein
MLKRIDFLDPPPTQITGKGFQERMGFPQTTVL